MSARPHASPAVVEPVILAAQWSADAIGLDLLIPESLFYFRGHFPDHPILPGIVQLHWAIRFGRQHLPVGAGPAQMVRVKFVRPIGPETRLMLRMTHAQSANRLSFDYRDEQGAFSSGQIGFS